MSEIKLIALDLDGTLLNSDKQLTSACSNVLEGATTTGIDTFLVGITAPRWKTGKCEMGFILPRKESK